MSGLDEELLFPGIRVDVGVEKVSKSCEVRRWTSMGLLSSIDGSFCEMLYEVPQKRLT